MAVGGLFLVAKTQLMKVFNMEAEELEEAEARYF